MNKTTLTSGVLCANKVVCRMIKKDILPNHGIYYKGAQEQKDKRRFIEFLDSPDAETLDKKLNKKYNYDGSK